jgi:outer membrane murein-binding lipoprotein Lpp
MAKRMTRMAAAAVAAACLTPLILAGCATKGSGSRAEQEQADLNAPITKASSGVQRFRIKDWSAPDDHTVIIVTNDGTRFRAETLGPCMGLAFATRVGFVNRGNFNQIDRTSSVVLADGTRCPFQSFDEIRSAESKALDSYEKAPESKPKPDSTAKQDNEKKSN